MMSNREAISWLQGVDSVCRCVVLAVVVGVGTCLARADEEAGLNTATDDLLFAPLFHSENVEDSVLLRMRYMAVLNGEDWLSPPQRYLGDDLRSERLRRFEEGVFKRLAVKGVVSQIANAPKDARFFHLFNPLAPPEYFGPDPSLRSPTEHSFDFNVFGDATLSGQLLENGR